LGLVEIGDMSRAPPFTGRDVAVDGDRERGCGETGQAGQRGY